MGVDKELTDLRRQARNLRPVLHVGRAGLTENVVEQVRQTLRHHPLIKVRISADDRNAVAQTARELADRVPCRLIDRTGFVAVFQARDMSAAASTAPHALSEVEHT